MASIARFFRATAKKLKVPVFLLSQLSRPDRKDGKRRLAGNWDLKESGDIENTADAIVLINKLANDDESNWDAMIHVSKQRMGRKGMVGFHFIGEHVRFEEQLIPGEKIKEYGLG